MEVQSIIQVQVLSKLHTDKSLGRMQTHNGVNPRVRARSRENWTIQRNNKNLEQVNWEVKPRLEPKQQHMSQLMY